jgi:hypothetical protein
VLGLSVDIRTELTPWKDDARPNYTTVGFTSFVGGLGIIAAFIGLAALFTNFVKPLVAMIFDSLTALCFLAGGIVSLQHSLLSHRPFEEIKYSFITQAASTTLPSLHCSEVKRYSGDGFEIIKRLCVQNRADSVFCFLAFAVTLALIGYGFVKRKELGPGGFI